MVEVAAFDPGLAAFQGSDQFQGVFRYDFLVKRILRIHTHQRAFAAKFHATNATHFHFVAQAGVLHRLLKFLFDAFRIGRHAAGRHAAANDRLFAGGPFLLGNRVEVINYHLTSILSIWRPRFRGFAVA